MLGRCGGLRRRHDEWLPETQLVVDERFHTATTDHLDSKRHAEYVWSY